ncbi:MAG: hypothetical protein IKF01_03775 [Bacilli bacterium]|nr:hypothetical protein [Bacilli bacterium]
MKINSNTYNNGSNEQNNMSTKDYRVIEVIGDLITGKATLSQEDTISKVISEMGQDPIISYDNEGNIILDLII